MRNRVLATRPRAGLFLVVVIVASAIPLHASAAPASGPVVAEWRYTISIPDPASGKVHVQLEIAGLKDVVTRFSFATAAHRETVTNVVGGADTPLASDGSGVSFDVDGNESFSYDVNVDRPAFVAGQSLSHSGSDFALFKAESIALEYRYSYYEGTRFTNHTTVRLAAPTGWDARGPWHAVDPTRATREYELPDGAVLPRGYVVFGKFLATEEKAVGGKLVHYVRLGKPAAFESGFYGYIDKATPYYAAVYGPGTHEDVLIVNAPDPMFRGGLGGADSFFVHESADLRTVAHEYAHVFQQFGTDERAGTSSIWINEGDADRQSALSLYAAGVWTTQNVNDFFHAAQRDQTDPDLATARLPDASYGTTLERFAYHKGAVVLEALDALMKRDSGGQVGIGDVLRKLNALHGATGGASAAQPVTTIEMRSVAESVLHEDLGDFFGNYVDGTRWPTISPFVPEGQIVVSGIALDPARAAPGDPVLVRALATNRGTSAISRLIDLGIDDAPRLQRANVSLAVGASQTLEFHIVAGAPGDHVVRILDASATLHALTPPRVTIARTSTVPTTLRAGEAAQLLVYVTNDGETPGTARVRAETSTGLLAASTETIVDANGTEVLTLPITLPTPGLANVTLTLITPQGDATRTLAFQVAQALPPDEVPGILSGGKGVPALPWAAALAASLAAAFTRKRHRRP